MPIDKSDKIQMRDFKTCTYKYSHADDITVNGKHWKRHVWKLVIPQGHWSPTRDTRIMEFEIIDKGNTP